MKPYRVAPKEDSPEVLLNPDTNVFYIRGRSYMENTLSFYNPIREWLIDYLSIPDTILELELRFVYISTSSVKEIVRIFSRLENLYNNQNLVINWFYPDDDEDLLELGEDISDIFEFPFVLKPYSFGDFDFL